MIRAVKSDHWAITISNIFSYKQIILERFRLSLICPNRIDFRKKKYSK